MAELEKTESQRSWRRTRTNSRPDQPATPRLERLNSGRYLDDQSYYDHDDHDEYTVDHTRSISVTDKVAEEHSEEDSVKGGKDDANDGRDENPDRRDLESKGPPLEKRTTTRSVKPENLVSKALPNTALQADAPFLGNVGWA